MHVTQQLLLHLHRVSQLQQLLLRYMLLKHMLTSANMCEGLPSVCCEVTRTVMRSRDVLRTAQRLSQQSAGFDRAMVKV